MESRYLIDWFSLTSKILSPDDWVNLLGFHGLGLKEIRGVHGFPNRLYYDGVNIKEALIKAGKSQANKRR